MKKFITLITLSIILFTQTAFAVELEELELALSEDEENPILQTALKMVELKDRTENPSNYSDDYYGYYDSFWRISPSALKTDLAGGLNFTNSNDFGGGLDILTGEKAIDESLQLGSIGASWRGEPENPDETYSIDDIEVADIASHPWEEMIKGQEYEVPEITKAVPEDTLMVYFSEPMKYLELEKVMEELLNTFDYDLYTLAETTQLKPKILKRLGVPEDEFLLNSVEEMVFISEDLDFIPGSDYGVVIKFKNESFEKGFDVMKADYAISEKVGDYTVVVTYDGLLEKIKNAYANEEDSMSGAKDYQYALSVLETRNHGMIYLSETFIRKLTGPAYRLNSARRDEVVDSLENLQYVVFAYRYIEGEWPESFKEIEKANYINDDAIYKEGKYSIDENGIVNHEDWGSLWGINPINRVEINEITAYEKEDYDWFAGEYQNYFTAFFDPIGISFTVSDQILFHTIILPLIDESEYNIIKAGFGNNGEESMSPIFNLHRLGAFNIAAKFSIYNLLEELAESEGIDSIEEIEEEISEELGLELKKGEKLFDFIGDEISFGIGEKNSFNFNNLADLDLWFGVKLKDQEKAKEFLKEIMAVVGEEMGGSAGYGLFSVSTTEPIKNTYNGVEYYMIPTGYLNLYYVFLDDTFYATVSQLSINYLIDAQGKIKNDFEKLERPFAFIDNYSHITSTVDLEKISKWTSPELEEEFEMSDYAIRNAFLKRKNYLSEALTLASILPEYDGTLKNVEQYYRYIPSEYVNGEFIVEDSKIYFENDETKAEMSEINLEFYYYGYDEEEGLDITDLVNREVSIEEIKEKIGTFKNAAIGVSFTEEGLDVKITFGNPSSDDKDDRFSFESPWGVDLRIDKKYLYIGAGAVGGIILLIIIIAVIKKKK